MNSIGRERRAIAEGYIPGWSHGPAPQFTSHETACLLNADPPQAGNALITTMAYADTA
jgi:hypothetical protein